MFSGAGLPFNIHTEYCCGSQLRNISDDPGSFKGKVCCENEIHEKGRGVCCDNVYYSNGEFV